MISSIVLPLAAPPPSACPPAPVTNSDFSATYMDEALSAEAGEAAPLAMVAAEEPAPGAATAEAREPDTTASEVTPETAIPGWFAAPLSLDTRTAPAGTTIATTAFDGPILTGEGREDADAGKVSGQSPALAEGPEDGYAAAPVMRRTDIAIDGATAVVSPEADTSPSKGPPASHAATGLSSPVDLIKLRSSLGAETKLDSEDPSAAAASGQSEPDTKGFAHPANHGHSVSLPSASFSDFADPASPTASATPPAGIAASPDARPGERQASPGLHQPGREEAIATAPDLFTSALEMPQRSAAAMASGSGAPSSALQQQPTEAQVLAPSIAIPSPEPIAIRIVTPASASGKTDVAETRPPAATLPPWVPDALSAGLFAPQAGKFGDSPELSVLAPQRTSGRSPKPHGEGQVAGALQLGDHGGAALARSVSVSGPAEAAGKDAASSRPPNASVEAPASADFFTDGSAPEDQGPVVEEAPSSLNPSKIPLAETSASSPDLGRGGITVPDAPAASRPVAPGGEALVPRPLPPEVAPALTSLATQGGGGVEVALSPKELGHVTLRMEQDGSALRVTVTADRADTLDLMRRNAAHLQQELRDAGFASSTFSFSERGGDQRPSRPQVLDGDQHTVPMPFPRPPMPDGPRASGLDLRM